MRGEARDHLSTRGCIYASRLTPHASPVSPSRLTPHLLTAAVTLAILAGCGSTPKQQTTRIEREPPRAVKREPQVAKAPQPPAPARAPVLRRGGGYYLDDGPGDAPPADLDRVPDAVPQPEPLRAATMRPYAVMGQQYTPMTELQPYKARGVASWYGRRYHGRQTSSGEIYDMYSMTAAHPLLPIPSYARVTNVATGKSVIVRINDRGPFIDSRLIDLSYTAAYKLGVLAGGSAVVEVETIIPDGSPAAPATLYASAPDPILAIATAAGVTLEPIPPGATTAATPAAATPAAGASATAPAPPPTPAASAPAASAPAGNIFLQLGAFGSRENAESYLARAKAQVEWLAQQLHLVPRDGMYRVHAGPYSSASEARQAAERVGLALGMKPVVVVTR